MRVEMVGAILTTPTQLDARLDDRTGAIARAAGSDDNADSDPVAGKSVATRHIGQTYVDDSDDDSLSSSAGSSNLEGLDSSSEDDIDHAGDNSRRIGASRFRTRQNPIFEQGKMIGTSVGENLEPSKQMANSVLQHEDVVGNYERNSANEVDHERSRLMAAALAAGIPSDDDYFSDDEGSRNSTRNYASIDLDERSRLMAAAQAASIPSDADFSDDAENYATEVDEISRLMAAAQKASIPSDDSFSDDDIEQNGSPDPRSKSITPQTSKERSTLGSSGVSKPTVAKAHQDSAEHVSDEGSSSLSDETDSDRSSSEDESQIKVQKKPRIRKTFKSGRVPRNTAGSQDGDPDDGLSRSDPRKPKKNDVNSASFPPKTASFNWSNVKTKVFYSFRALKASAGSSSDGSRTISARNLAREVTELHLRDFFQDCGNILDVWITSVAQSGLRSAYLEFESGDAARKAIRKSGKKLEGRVIVCDITYENSRGSNSGHPDSSHSGHSGPDSSHGARENSKGGHSGHDLNRGARENSKGGHNGPDSVGGVRENSKVGRSGPDSVRGVREKGTHGGPDSSRSARHRSELFESHSASIGGRMMDNQSGLKIFPPELHEGDEKFLSRFSEQANVSNFQRAAGNPESVSISRQKGSVVSRGLPRNLSTVTHSRGLPRDLPIIDVGARKGVALVPWNASVEPGFDDSLLMPGKTQAEIEESIYFDAEDFEAAQQSSLAVGRKIAWPWGRRQRFFWPWKWPHWQGQQHSAKRTSQSWSSTSWARRKSSNLRSTELKLIDRKRRPKAREKTSSGSEHKVIDTKVRKNWTTVAVNCESVSLWC